MKPEVTTEYSKATKHPKESVRGLLLFSIPLMLSLLSENIMLFFDRMILAHYSLDAMNAASAASFFCSIFQYGTTGIAVIAEVFVAQYNTSDQNHKTSQPVWQMIWFSFLTIFIFIPVGIWGGDLMLSPYYKQEYGLPYFQWFMYFAPLFPLLAAFSAFFIGIGRAKIVTVTVFFGNILNILLDILLIFGYSDIIPCMGTKGAALATGLAQLFQVAILALMFFNSYNRKHYSTSSPIFRFKLFARCLRLGLPSAIGYMLEMTSWATIAYLASIKGELFITVMTVGQSIYTLVAFCFDGLQRGVCICSGSFLVMHQQDKVRAVWKSGVKVVLGLMAFFSLILIFYPDPIIDQFLSCEKYAQNYHEMVKLLRITAFSIWIFIFFDGISSISTGVLVSSGDTRFVLVSYILYICFYTFLPIYIQFKYLDTSPLAIWTTVAIASFLNACLSFGRYKHGKWSTKAPITS